MNAQLLAVCSFALCDQRQTDPILVPLCAIAASSKTMFFEMLRSTKREVESLANLGGRSDL